MSTWVPISFQRNALDCATILETTRLHSILDAQSEKVSLRRLESTQKGEKRAFSVYSQKSAFAGAVSIWSISLPKCDQQSKRRAYSD